MATAPLWSPGWRHLDAQRRGHATLRTPWPWQKYCLNHCGRTTLRAQDSSRLRIHCFTEGERKLRGSMRQNVLFSPSVSEQLSTASVIGQIRIGLISAPPRWRYDAVRLTPTQWRCGGIWPRRSECIGTCIPSIHERKDFWHALHLKGLVWVYSSSLLNEPWSYFTAYSNIHYILIISRVGYNNITPAEPCWFHHYRPSAY